VLLGECLAASIPDHAPVRLSLTAMTNQKVEGRRTVHRKYDDPAQECRGLRSIMDRSTLIDTDEPANCSWCTGVRAPKPTTPVKAIPAKRGRPARAASVSAAAQQLVPTTPVAAPPLKYSGVLYQVAQDLMRMAFSMESEGL
jgi:hypothetical protein